MDQTMHQLAQALKENKGAVQQIMQSKDGQDLMRRLQQQGDLQKAVSAAAKGNTEQLSQMVRGMMGTQEGAQLAEKIRRSVTGK